MASASSTRSPVLIFSVPREKAHPEVKSVPACRNAYYHGRKMLAIDQSYGLHVSWNRVELHDNLTTVKRITTGDLSHDLLRFPQRCSKALCRRVAAELQRCPR
jgi:hypothetical protein